MKPLPRPVLAIARDRFGLLTVADLDAQSIRGRARNELLQEGVLVPVHRGVYRLADHPVSFELRCAAALLAAPSAVLAGPTAGRFWGLRKVYTDDVHLLSRGAVRLEGVTGHRSYLLERHDWCVRARMRLLRPGRLLCDLAWHLDEAALESVLEQMIDRGLLTISAARAQARRFAAPGRPGTTRLVRVLDGRPDWLRPAQSDLELRLARALGARGQVLRRQWRVELDGGGTVRLDLACPQCRLGLEVDHVTWHGGRLDAQADKRRDRQLVRLGWLMIRVTDEDVVRRLSSTVDDIVAIHAQRCPAGS